MPFTLSHIALVLPLKNTKELSFTGLVVGSIVPDFEFYFQLKEGTQIAHTINGIFLFNLPLAIILTFIFHLLLRDPLINNLPRSLRSKYDHIIGFDWLNYCKQNKLKLTVSIVLGCSGHILLDGFTHQDSLLAQYLPILTTNIGVFNKPLADMLQIILSALGLIYLLWDLVKIPTSTITNPKSNSFKPFWSILISAAFIILLFRLMLFPEYNSFWGIIIATIGSVCYAWIISAITSLIYSQKNINNVKS